MKESTSISCSCYGPASYNQEKFFLTRKRETNEPEHPFSARKVNKSAELKTDHEGKTQKKSLKKRPGSAVPAEHQNFIGTIEPVCNEIQIKQKNQEEVIPKSRSFWTRGSETPTYSPQGSISNFHGPQYPQSATNSRQPTFNSTFNEYKPIHIHQIPPNATSHIVPLHMGTQKPPQLRPQLQQLKDLMGQNLNQSQNISSRIRQNIKVPSIQDLKNKSVMSKEALLSQQPKLYSNCLSGRDKNSRQQTETFTINEEDLFIEGFDKLFKNKDDAVVLRETNKTHMNARQLHQSNKLQKQKLFGRFAQSDGQSDSESTPSEVIGRGFDRRYQEDFGDNDNEGVGEETKASRSTNTKHSEMHIGDKRMSEVGKSIFGANNQFMSYKYL